MCLLMDSRPSRASYRFHFGGHPEKEALFFPKCLEKATEFSLPAMRCRSGTNCPFMQGNIPAPLPTLTHAAARLTTVALASSFVEHYRCDVHTVPATGLTHSCVHSPTVSLKCGRASARSRALRPPNAGNPLGDRCPTGTQARSSACPFGAAGPGYPP